MACMDVLKKQGFVNVGIDHNTAEFAVASLTSWWYTRGRTDYPGATAIQLFCDNGSSNSFKQPALEVVLAAICQPNKAESACLSLSTRDIEVERHRA